MWCVCEVAHNASLTPGRHLHPPQLAPLAELRLDRIDWFQPNRDPSRHQLASAVPHVRQDARGVSRTSLSAARFASLSAACRPTTQRRARCPQIPGLLVGLCDGAETIVFVVRSELVAKRRPCHMPLPLPLPGSCTGAKVLHRCAGMSCDVSGVVMFVFRFSGAGADLPFLSSSFNSAPLGSLSPKAAVVT